jgi:hypothetical protein
LAKPFMQRMDGWQSRLAQLSSAMHSSYLRPEDLAPFADELLELRAAARSCNDDLEEAVRQAPAPVSGHSRIGDIRKALAGIEPRIDVLLHQAQANENPADL